MLEVVRRLIACSCLLTAFSAVAQDAFEWQSVATVNLAVGERKIVLVEQQGFDLAVRLMSDSQVLSVQEGPDMAFGTEVIALQNSGGQALTLELQLAPVLKLAALNFRLSELSDFNAGDWAIAQALYDANQLWVRQDSSADDVIALLEPMREQRASSLLDELLWLSLADALVRSGQSERSISILAPYLAERSRNTPQAIYLHWQNTIALYQGLYVQEALEQAQMLVGSLDAIPLAAFANEIEAQWLRAQVRNSLAAIMVGAARLRGDDELLHDAGEIFHSNLQAIAGHADVSLRARLTEYLGGFYSFSEGRTSQISRRLLQEAEELYRAAGDEAPLSALRNNQAYAALGRGDINEALRLYLEALELGAASKHEEGRAFIRARLGYLYFTLGDYRRAQMRYQESIEIYHRLGLTRRLVHNQLELAEVLRAAGESSQALQLLYEVRAVQGEDAPLEEGLRLASQIAHGLLDNGDIEVAAEILVDVNREFELDTKTGRERLEFASRQFYVLEYDILRIRLLLARNQTEQAKNLIDETLSQIADGRSEPLQQLELLHLLMLANKNEQDRSSLLAAGKRALNLVEAVGDAVDYQFQGARWSSRTAHIQQLMVTSYLQEYLATGDILALDAGIDLGQQYRARNLRQSRLVSLNHSTSSVLDAAHNEMAGVRQELVSALLAGNSTVDLENELARREEAYQRQRMQIFAGNPELASLDRKAIEASLGSDEAALIYNLGEDVSHLIVLEPGEEKIFILPSREELLALSSAALGELQTLGSELDSLVNLARTLFPMQLSLEDKNSLLIEAEGMLTRLPFNVLAHYRDDEHDKLPAITMVPSLSEYFADGAVRVEVQSERLDVAIVADPIINVATGANAQFAVSEPDFPRLPYTQVEAEAIIDTFGSSQTHAFLGADASIENLRNLISREARILHIASHGFASPDDPLMLGLALANRPGDSVASGLLTVEQIASTAFANELVVISACETGVGQALNGEPLMSMGRMFLANGAKSALTTLWPISDRANAEFMSSFYEALGELSLPPAEALGYAQSQLMQSARYRHPFYWGAFQYQAAQRNTQAVHF